MIHDKATERRSFLAACVLAAALALPSVASAAEDAIAPEVLNMPMREWGRLGLFVRAEYIERFSREFGFDRGQRDDFHACLIAAAADPRTRGLSFRRASRECVMYARDGQ